MMLMRKIDRGLYEIIDEFSNNYRIEDGNRPEPQYDRPEWESKNLRWGIFEQSEGDWVFLDGNPTMKDCLGVIETWAAASQLGT
jgi:hypothetical protein